MYDVIIGHYREDKNIPFGVKHHRIELKLRALVEDCLLYNIYSVFWKFWKFWICDHLSKKVIFLNFLASKKQNLKNPR